jgi:hypothetical protein
MLRGLLLLAFGACLVVIPSADMYPQLFATYFVAMGLASLAALIGSVWIIVSDHRTE